MPAVPSKQQDNLVDYPRPEDEAITHYWSLKPLRFTILERLELSQPVPWDHDEETTLRMLLRSDVSPGEALLLVFTRVGDLDFHGGLHISGLTILSLAGRGWERYHYAVDNGGTEQLHFYCDGITASIIALDEA